MDTHNSEIVETRQLSDGQISVRLRCCGHEQSDSWHTLEVSPDHAEADIHQWLADRRAQVEAQHDGLLRAKAVLEKFQPSS